VSIETSILQDEWESDSSILAMKEALAISTGVSMDSIDVNYANELCKQAPTFPAPTFSPTFSPTREPTIREPTTNPTTNRRILVESLSSVPPDQHFSPSLIHIADHGESHQLDFSFLIQLFGNDTTLSVNKTIAATQTKITTAVFTGSFCYELVLSSRHNNVTNLITPTGINAIGLICADNTRTPVFNSLFIAGTETQPSSYPTDSPSFPPTKNPSPVRPEVMTTKVVGFVSVVVLIFLLRFYQDFINLFYTKPKELSGHRYDVLVTIDKDNDAIIENINHEDIAFFRSTDIKEKDEKIAWTINDTAVPIQKRFEVQFFDKYDLLNDPSIKEEGDKTIKIDTIPLKDGRRKSMLLNKVDMQKGMVIRVKIKGESAKWGLRAYSNEFDSFAETARSGKKPLQSPKRSPASGKKPMSSSKKGCPSDHVISKFVINNSSINEKIKLAAEKYRLETPRGGSFSSPQGLGSVSIDMEDMTESLSPGRGLNKMALDRAIQKSVDGSSDSESSVTSSEITHNHRRSPGAVKSYAPSDGEELNEEHDEHESSEEENEEENEESEESVYEESVISQENDEKTSIRAVSAINREDSITKSVASKKDDAPWSFPSEEGYEHDREGWKVQESARLRRGSWRQEGENLDTSLRRGHWRLGEDDDA